MLPMNLTISNFFVLLIAVACPLFIVPRAFIEARTRWESAASGTSAIVCLGLRAWAVWFHLILVCSVWMTCVALGAGVSYFYNHLNGNQKFIAFILFLLPASLVLLQLMALKIYSWLRPDWKDLARRAWYGFIVLFFIWALLGTRSDADRDTSPSLLGGADQELTP
jgi:hypothetical protein